MRGPAGALEGAVGRFVIGRADGGAETRKAVAAGVGQGAEGPVLAGAFPLPWDAIQSCASAGLANFL